MTYKSYHDGNSGETDSVRCWHATRLSAGAWRVSERSPSGSPSARSFNSSYVASDRSRVETVHLPESTRTRGLAVRADTGTRSEFVRERDTYRRAVFYTTRSPIDRSYSSATDSIRRTSRLERSRRCVVFVETASATASSSVGERSNIARSCRPLPFPFVRVPVPTTSTTDRPPREAVSVLGDAVGLGTGGRGWRASTSTVRDTSQG